METDENIERYEEETEKLVKINLENIANDFFDLLKLVCEDDELSKRDAFVIVDLFIHNLLCRIMLIYKGYSKNMIKPSLSEEEKNKIIKNRLLGMLYMIGKNIVDEEDVKKEEEVH